MTRTLTTPTPCPALPDIRSLMVLYAMAIPAARDVRGNGRKANSEDT